jgi:hypothetical protein
VPFSTMFSTVSAAPPAGACVTVPDQVPFVPFACGRGRSADDAVDRVCLRA